MMDAFLQSEAIQAVGSSVTMIAALIGLWMLLTAITVPGTGIPEAGSAVSLVLAVLGMFALHASLAGVLLLAAALGVFIAQIYYRHLWPLAIGGFALQALGTFFLFGADARPSLWLMGVINAAALIYYLLIVQPGLRIQDRAEAVGADPLIGAKGEVVSTLDPHGSIRLQGTIWQARSNEVIPGGAWVQVVGRDGLELQVVPSMPEPLADIVIAE